MKVERNHDLCQGHARCAAMAPELFVLDNEGYVATTSRPVPAGLEDAARTGEKVCPEKVISVHE